MIKKICIVAEHYPTPEEPMFPFVQQLAFSLSKEGIECHIIAPQSVSRNLIRHQRMKPTHTVEVSPDGFAVYVYRPFFVSVSNFPNKYLQHLEDLMLGRVVWGRIDKIKGVDAIYCYFWHVALTVALQKGKRAIPIFVQASECNLTIDPYMITDDNLARISGVVCASKKNQEESIKAKLTKVDDTCIVVNGYRTDEFYPKDKRKARAKMGFDENAFIIAFVGGFIERKGIRELCEAIKRVDKGIQSIFIGTGNVLPTCNNIIFQGRVAHNHIVDYLNCADLFVLPTRAEGCCNAIIEALACGLPVISSDKTFNNEILDDGCSIRLNETDVEAIADAIIKLKEDNELRNSMSKAALEKAASLTIDKRAKSIIRFINGRVQKDKPT